MTGMQIGALWCIAGVSLLTGCATTPTRLYSGPELPPSQVAKISAEQQQVKVAYTHITEIGKIVSVDGQEMKGLTITKAVYVHPGKHEVVAQVHGSSPGPSLGALGSAAVAQTAENEIERWNAPLTFNAEAGKNYIIRFKGYNSRETPGKYVYWIEDEETRKYICGWRPDDGKQ